MQTIKIKDMSVHPELEKLEVSQSQIERMSFLMGQFGQFQPILISIQDGQTFVVDGLIRFHAAKQMKWDDLTVIEVDWQSDEIIQNRCISNVSIKKTHWNLAIEIHMFMNTLVGKSRGKKRKLEDFIKYFGNCDEMELEGILGDVSQMAIAVFGLSFGKSTLRMFNRMFEKHIDAPQELLDLKLFEKLDNGEISISRAHDLTMEYFETKKNHGNNALRDVIEYSRTPINEDVNHQIYCQTNEDLSFLTNNGIQTVITSPPYFGRQAEYKEAEKNLAGVIHGNEKTVEEYIDNEVKIYRQLKTKLKKDGSLFVIIGDAFRGDDNCIPERLVTAMLNDGWHCPSRMLWAKANQKPQKISGRLQPAGEHILHFTLTKKFKWREFLQWTDEPVTLGKTNGDDFADGVKRPGYYLKRPYKRFRTFIEEQNFVGVLKQNCFNVEEVKEFGKPEHPCPYPINLAMFLMLLTTEIGDVCADVYGGIGSLSHAAKVLHRNSISIDVDQVSTKYAINRIDSCDHHIFTEDELDEVESIFSTPIKRKVRSAA